MAQIQVLGVSDAPKMSILRANVIQALQEMGVNIVVETINDVDLFIKYEIDGIPALVVNGTVVLQKEVSTVEDLKNLLKPLVLPRSNSFEMKNIIVATDFSDVAQDAYNFALEITEFQGGQLKVVHVYHPEYDPQNPYIAEPILSLKEMTEERLSNFAATRNGKVGERAPANVRQEVVIGFPVEELVKASSDPDTDMIVMGATGEKGLLGKLFGTVSTNVAQKASCPVLLVPKGVKFDGFKNILYASNFESASEETLNRLVSFANSFQSNVHFVHVSDEDKRQDYKAVEKKLFETLFHEGEPSFSFTMSNVEGTSVVESLDEYALRHQIDLVVLVSPQRSFWEGLFHKSVTKAMALNTKFPIMALHK